MYLLTQALASQFSTDVFDGSTEIVFSSQEAFVRTILYPKIFSFPSYLFQFNITLYQSIFHFRLISELLFEFEESILIVLHDEEIVIDQSSHIFIDESQFDISISAKAYDMLVTQSSIEAAKKLLFFIFIKFKLIYKSNARLQ
jgi:hypothetical protein